MTTRIFTKRFFEASHSDQVQIVDAAVAALEEVIGRSPDKCSRQKAKRMLRRLVRKAVEHGIHQGDRGEGERDQGGVPCGEVVLNTPARKTMLDRQIKRVVAAIKKMPGPKVVKILVFSRRCEYTFLLVKGDRMFVLDDGYSYVVATMEAFTSKLSTALLNGGLLVNQIADGDDGKVYVAAFSEGVIRPFSPEDVKELAEQCAKAGEPVELFDGASYGSFADFLE